MDVTWISETYKPSQASAFPKGWSPLPGCRTLSQTYKRRACQEHKVLSTAGQWPQVGGHTRSEGTSAQGASRSAHARRSQQPQALPPLLYSQSLSPSLLPPLSPVLPLFLSPRFPSSPAAPGRRRVPVCLLFSGVIQCKWVKSSR